MKLLVNPMKLTKQEHKILAAMAQGFTYTECCDIHKIAPSTLKRHVANIFEKSHVHTQTQAVVWYYKQRHMERLKRYREQAQNV